MLRTLVMDDNPSGSRTVCGRLDRRFADPAVEPMRQRMRASRRLRSAAVLSSGTCQASRFCRLVRVAPSLVTSRRASRWRAKFSIDPNAPAVDRYGRPRAAC